MAMKGGVTLAGNDELKRLLKKGGTSAIPALAASLTAVAQIMMYESQVQVPFRTGALKASGRVFEPNITGTTVTVDLGYGGDASDYAFFVHENSSLTFQNGKKAKYLADPVGAGAGALTGILMSRLQKALG